MWIYEEVVIGVSKKYYRVGYIVGDSHVWVERYVDREDARYAVHYLNGGGQPVEY